MIQQLLCWCALSNTVTTWGRDSHSDLLSPAEVDGMPAWSARLSSSIAPHYAVAIASSNLWPGAHTFTIGKYVGRDSDCTGTGD